MAGANTQIWYGQNVELVRVHAERRAVHRDERLPRDPASVVGLQATFASPALSAFVEAAARTAGTASCLRGTGTVNWDVVTSGVPQPQLKVVYYR